MSRDPVLARELDALRARYLERLPARLDAIDALVAPLLRARDAEGADAIRALHSLAGTAESFGLGALGAAARAVEHTLTESDGGARGAALAAAWERFAVEASAARTSLRS